jgi:hypothetical protein
MRLLNDEAISVFIGVHPWFNCMIPVECPRSQRPAPSQRQFAANPLRIIAVQKILSPNLGRKNAQKAQNSRALQIIFRAVCAFLRPPL